MVSIQFCCSKQERQELVVIESPHAVAARGFQFILQLDFSNEFNIELEHPNKLMEVFGLLLQLPNFLKTEQEHQKTEFVTCSIVNSLLVSEGLLEVFHNFGYLFRRHIHSEMFQLLVEFSESWIAVTLGLVLMRGYFIQQLLD